MKRQVGARQSFGWASALAVVALCGAGLARAQDDAPTTDEVSEVADDGAPAADTAADAQDGSDQDEGLDDEDSTGADDADSVPPGDEASDDQSEPPADAVDVTSLSDEEQAEVLLDADDERACNLSGPAQATRPGVARRSSLSFTRTPIISVLGVPNG